MARCLLAGKAVAGSVDAERAWEALGFEVVEQVRLRALPAR